MVVCPHIFYKQITNITREIFSEVVNLHQACESCDKKTFAFVGMGIGKKTCVGWRWDGQRSLGGQCPFCWCVCVCGVKGGLGLA